MTTLWFAFSFGLKMFATSQLACEAARSSYGNTTAPIYRLEIFESVKDCCERDIIFDSNTANCKQFPVKWGCFQDAPIFTVMECVSAPAYSVREVKP